MASNSCFTGVARPERYPNSRNSTELYPTAPNPRVSGLILKIGWGAIPLSGIAPQPCTQLDPTLTKFYSTEQHPTRLHCTLSLRKFSYVARVVPLSGTTLAWTTPHGTSNGLYTIILDPKPPYYT